MIRELLPVEHGHATAIGPHIGRMTFRCLPWQEVVILHEPVDNFLQQISNRFLPCVWRCGL